MTSRQQAEDNISATAAAAAAEEEICSRCRHILHHSFRYADNPVHGADAGQAKLTVSLQYRSRPFMFILTVVETIESCQDLLMY